jgi:perosamine synthetase
VVEDAAHAFGSSHAGRALGTFGDAGCFSFDPIKNITCGEGGAVATHSAALAERLAPLRMLGMAADGWNRQATGAAGGHHVRSRGWRCHLPNINAAIGLVQLGRLDAFRARKQAIVARYDAALAGLAGLERVTRPRPDWVPFTYVVRVPGGQRDALAAHLRARGVGTAIEYTPNHLQPAFERYHAPLPVTERIYGEMLSLPLSTALTDEDVDRVLDGVTSFFAPAEVPCTRNAGS